MLSHLAIPSDEEAMMRFLQQQRISMASTTQESLEEDGAEEAHAALVASVEEAQEAIKRLLLMQPDRTWTIRELEDEAAGDYPSPPSVMSIAFLRLLNTGCVSVDDDLSVRAV